MKTVSRRAKFRRSSGFSTVELIGAILLFSAATGGVLVMGKALRDHRAAAASSNEQNAYATFQSQVALQGINPALVANPLGAAVNRGLQVTGAAPAGGLNVTAAFEAGAVSQIGDARAYPTERIDAVTYKVASAGNQTGRGSGIGFAIQTAGSAPIAASNATALAPPIFNITGDLTGAAFPVNGIATLPSSNPTGTVYRYTTDGSAPNGSSPVWNNDPAWTPQTFPSRVALQAFNPDPQYLPSPVATATYSMTLTLSYARADNRASDPYGFTLAELGAPDASGVVLSGNVDSFPILYTLDGSDPSSSASAVVYAGPFTPSAAQFAPSVTLKAVAQSSDPRVNSSPVMTYSLGTDLVPLSAPSFITSNSQPLPPGTPVQISVSGTGGSPRTEVNNGTPGQSSSQSTSFPLN